MRAFVCFGEIAEKGQGIFLPCVERLCGGHVLCAFGRFGGIVKKAVFEGRKFFFREIFFFEGQNFFFEKFFFSRAKIFFSRNFFFLATQFFFKTYFFFRRTENIFFRNFFVSRSKKLKYLALCTPKK